MAKYDAIYIFTTFVVILAGLIPFSFELMKEEETNTTGLFLLLSILVFITFYFIYTFIWSNIKKYINQIENNTKRINEIEKSFKYKDDFYKLEKRINMMELKMKKRGQIDPRWVFLIIILILLILYLRSQGII